MIHANELRIGNWFIGYDNKPFQFDYTDFMIIGTPAQWEQKPFEPDELIKSPIELTEDILLKCGAETFAGGGIILNYRLIEYAECRQVYYDASTSVELKYLHQLQNLYFALSGQELEVTF